MEFSKNISEKEKSDEDFLKLKENYNLIENKYKNTLRLNTELNYFLASTEDVTSERDELKQKHDDLIKKSNFF
jgi:hypothetical protein